MTKVIAISNQKGGVGKTTTAINLATALSTIGKKIMLLDIDPQGNASTGLGISNRSNNLYKVLTKEIDLSDAIIQTLVPNLDIIVSHQDLAGMEIELVSEDSPQTYLKEICLERLGSLGYDYVFIDCPPTLGMLTVNSLVYANSVLIPLQAEFFALEGISQLTKTVLAIKGNFNKQLSIQGVVLTMYDKRTNLSLEVEEQVRSIFGDLVYKSTIPRNVKVSEAPSYGKPVLLYDLSSAGAKAYLSLSKELIEQEKNSQIIKILKSGKLI